MTAPDFTDEHKRLIAELKTHPGYNALLGFMQAQVDDQADELANATTPADILRLTRLWQISRKFVYILRTAPEAIAETIASEREQPSAEAHPWAIQDDEDYFRRRPPTAPPLAKISVE